MANSLYEYYINYANYTPYIYVGVLVATSFRTKTRVRVRVAESAYFVSLK